MALLLPTNSKYKEIDDLKAAGDGVTVAVLQNVYAEEWVHRALPKAKVDQYDSVDLMYQTVFMNQGRIEGQGPPKALCEQPKSARLAEFLKNIRF